MHSLSPIYIFSPCKSPPSPRRCRTWPLCRRIRARVLLRITFAQPSPAHTRNGTGNLCASASHRYHACHKSLSTSSSSLILIQSFCLTKPASASHRSTTRLLLLSPVAMATGSIREMTLALLLGDFRALPTAAACCRNYVVYVQRDKMHRSVALSFIDTYALNKKCPD